MTRQHQAGKNSGVDDLSTRWDCLVDDMEEGKEEKKKALLFLTGVMRRWSWSERKPSVWSALKRKGGRPVCLRVCVAGEKKTGEG